MSRQKDGSPSLKAYGVAKVRFKMLVEMLAKMNKTIIFVAHSSEQKDGEDLIIRIDGSTSAVKEITKKLDALPVFALTVLNAAPKTSFDGASAPACQVS